MFTYNTEKWSHAYLTLKTKEMHVYPSESLKFAYMPLELDDIIQMWRNITY